MIAEIIKQIQSNEWYGCGDIIETAKGKNAIPKTWREAKEKIKRARFMEADKAKTENNNTGLIKTLVQWLSRKR